MNDNQSDTKQNLENQQAEELPLVDHGEQTATQEKEVLQESTRISTFLELVSSLKELRKKTCKFYKYFFCTSHQVLTYLIIRSGKML